MNFGKKYFNKNVCFDLQILSEIFLILRRNQRDAVINVHRSSCRVPVIHIRFEPTVNLFDIFSKNLQIPSFMKIPLVGADLFHADRQTDGRTDMTKPVVAFRNFTNAPKNGCNKQRGRNDWPRAVELLFTCWDWQGPHSDNQKQDIGNVIQRHWECKSAALPWRLQVTWALYLQTLLILRQFRSLVQSVMSNWTQIHAATPPLHEPRTCY
jgi:hypothetical protein